METIKIKIAFTGILIVLSIISGIWLHRKERPLNAIIFNMHKLISLAAIVLIVITVIAFNKNVDLRSTDFMLIALTALFLILLVVTGGILSLDKPVNFILLNIHRILTFFIVVSCLVTYFMLAINN